MPTVKFFNDPTLIAALATGAAQHAENAQQQADAADVIRAITANRAMLNEQAGRAASMEAAAGAADMGRWQGEMAAWAADPHNRGGVEVGGQFYPDGGAGPPGRGVGQVLPGGGFLSPAQRTIIQSVRAMRDSGYLSPEQAMRWEGIAAAGGNPLTEQTEAEQLRERQAAHPDKLSDYQRQSMGLRSGAEERQVQQDRYERRRNSLRDAIESKTKRLQQATSSEDRTKIQNEINGLESKLLNLSEDFEKPAAPPGQAGAAPAGATPQGKRPFTADEIAALVAKHKGDAAAARAEAIAAGWNGMVSQ